MQELKAITITHRHFELAEIGQFHIDLDTQEQRLKELKEAMGINELMYLTTCNRVEFLFTSDKVTDRNFLINFIQNVNNGFNFNKARDLAERTEIYEGEEAVRHIFSVASSLDSMVVGEREIITQVRNAYENSVKMSLSGDLIRLVLRATIETAKSVYTQTEISNHPVSIVSLAFRKLIEDYKLDASTKAVIVGAGETNTTMSRFLKKSGVRNFVVYNRGEANGIKLAKEVGGEYRKLEELGSEELDFDVLVACTGSELPTVTNDLFNKIYTNDRLVKLIDLGIPKDIECGVSEHNNVSLISIDDLKAISQQNLAERTKAIDSCEAIIDTALADFYTLYNTRQVELAMKDIPVKVKEIKNTALNSVFAKELESFDDSQKEVVDKLLQYIEKKYISVPMKLAKEILLEGTNSNK